MKRGDGVACVSVLYEVARCGGKAVGRILREERSLDGGISVDA